MKIYIATYERESTSMTPTEKTEFHWNWCLILLDEFRQLQRRSPVLERLKPPNVAIVDTLTSTLGRWHQDQRRIELSSSLFETDRIEMVLEVFHHEVAHQCVNELYHVSDAQSHGEAFKRACHLLDIPCRASIAIDELTVHPKRGRLLKRVSKLLAMERSDSPHEAEIALRKARELALKYNLDTGNEQDHYSFRPVRLAQKRIPGYLWSICAMVEEFYFCRYISRGIRHSDGTRYQVIEFYGLPENLELADYVFHYLLHHGEREWMEYKAKHGLKGRTKKSAFMHGLFSGFRRKLEKQNKQLVKETALVWTRDPKLDAFYRKRNPRVTTSKRTFNDYSDAREAGVGRGEKLTIVPGVKGSAKKGPNLLS